MRSPASPRLSLQRQLAERKGEFLADPHNFAYVLVYNTEFNSETYTKILVRESGEIVLGFMAPAALWLGHNHMRGKITLEKYDLHLSYGSQGAPNAWWEILRTAYPCLPVLRGDLIFGKWHEALVWSRSRFCEEFAKWVPEE